MDKQSITEKKKALLDRFFLGEQAPKPKTKGIGKDALLKIINNIKDTKKTDKIETKPQFNPVEYLFFDEIASDFMEY